MTDKPADQLAKLTADLFAAAEAHETAKREESAASSREISARNAMNESQKKFDAFVAQLKKNAPHDSHWGEERRRASHA